MIFLYPFLLEGHLTPGALTCQNFCTPNRLFSSSGQFLDRFLYPRLTLVSFLFPPVNQDTEI